MDLPTMLASGALSGAVSWITARHVAIRKHRAGDQEDARRELRKLVEPHRLRVAQYRAGIGGGLAREADRAHPSDAALAGRVLALAERLPWWRRRLVTRRLRRLVGPVWLDTARLTPGDESSAFGVTLALQVDAARRERRGETVERSDDLGLMHRALSASPDSPLARDLERELSRLAAGR